MRSRILAVDVYRTFPKVNVNIVDGLPFFTQPFIRPPLVL
jgi:hypothetical protein